MTQFMCLTQLLSDVIRHRAIHRAMKRQLVRYCHRNKIPISATWGTHASHRVSCALGRLKAAQERLVKALAFPCLKRVKPASAKPPLQVKPAVEVLPQPLKVVEEKSKAGTLSSSGILHSDYVESKWPPVLNRGPFIRHDIPPIVVGRRDVEVSVSLGPSLVTSTFYVEVPPQPPPPLTVEVNRVIQIVSLPQRPKRVRLSVSSFYDEIAPTRPIPAKPVREQSLPVAGPVAKLFGPGAPKGISPMGIDLIQSILAYLRNTENEDFCSYFFEEGVLGTLWSEGSVDLKGLLAESQVKPEKGPRGKTSWKKMPLGHRPS
jgi:hypothetical protein